MSNPTRQESLPTFQRTSHRCAGERFRHIGRSRGGQRLRVSAVLSDIIEIIIESGRVVLCLRAIWMNRVRGVAVKVNYSRCFMFDRCEIGFSIEAFSFLGSWKAASDASESIVPQAEPSCAPSSERNSRAFTERLSLRGFRLRKLYSDRVKTNLRSEPLPPDSPKRWFAAPTESRLTPPKLNSFAEGGRNGRRSEGGVRRNHRLAD